ncbi:uncharacterized protein FFB20_11594 [Fusarium fujikuroi]|uniref:Uncharacterized protein n=2 Tax=Fusarium fujikuroi TaxID=5127 RepID=S0EJV8_GIBF5|nr:uncharacterized protein FFUJ_09677 [Fusarium fujikuroi IMI 58289]KLO99008.1 uncharacterized protein Y057_6810 [Fusarium fujikuroi]KLP12427.1 uncharacterized protein LW94_2947 [Fusarium fujikuroi]QGI86505.1 hypothetical protein CEK25_013234 [Fusarium fujikuroi]CCT74147.1 uncharacterized protein FFUJ_09677 [Fusarium fujikuroi IMI 58289]SCO00729.1 uncharacterized protein FFC1_08706 [Fusarium fujikuroi]
MSEARCCVNDPCGRNNGTCPGGDLRATSFASDKYSQLPQQECDNSQGADNWHSCAHTEPPFLGCCSQNACSSECPRAKLVPAKLSEIENNRLNFLHPSQSQSSATSSVSETASTTASSTSVVDVNEGDGLGAGATAGIAVGALVGGLIVLVLVAWLFWWKPRQKNKHQREHDPGYSVPPAAPTLSANPFPPPSGPIHPSTFVAQSPMSGYQPVYPLLNSSKSIFRIFLILNDRNPPHTFRSTVPNTHTVPNFFLRTSNSTITVTTNQQQMGVASEMVGSTTLPQEMSTGAEHRINRHSSIVPETELSLARP